MKKNTTSIIATTVGIIVAAVVSKFVVNYFNDSMSFDEQLMQVSQEINKHCPFMIDQDTRLDNTIGGPGNSFTYNYTLVNYFAEEVDVDELKERIEPQMIMNIKTSPDMEQFRENNVTLLYKYRDKAGNFIFEIKISPGKYKESV
jgi:hypothetical protein